MLHAGYDISCCHLDADSRHAAATPRHYARLYADAALPHASLRYQLMMPLRHACHYCMLPH